MQISLNQKIIDPANIPIDHCAFLNGFSVFETMRTYHQVIFRLEDHLKRLFKSAEYLNLQSPWSTSHIKDSIQDLMLQNSSKFEQRFRVILADQDLIVMIMDLDEKPKEFYEQGVNLISYKASRAIPSAKILGDTICYVANNHAKANQAYDSILINPYNSQITECSYANLFWVKDTQLFTTDQNILKGITRQVAIELSENCQFKTINLDELKKADEIFITQTTSGILPVNQIDAQSFEVGEVTNCLMKEFNKLIWK